MSLWEFYDEPDKLDDDEYDGGSDDTDELDALEEAMQECAADGQGNCGKAGSEECEFECPFRF